jgi:hypothetical protein
MKEPEFDAEFQRAKRAAFGQAIARLQQGSSAAASTRLRASDCIFTHSKHAIEMEEIEARLGALEAANASKPGRRR